ncbi:MAG TPA: heparan-alpha-glucosaminide N-acetyltransferase domain-containing protein [Candidatus Limnocylindrales bacterium]|jgi:uncharacterized membrane protein
MESSRPIGLNPVTGIADRSRVRAFDLAAGLAVLFMILVHVLWHWGAEPTWTTPIGQAISYAAGPTAAPVFAFLMGASLGAAPRASFSSMAARGLWLVVLGYVLNLLRGVIPASLGLASGVITAEQVQPYTLWWLGTTVDLHHMIGLTLVATAALRVKVEPGWLWVGLGGALVLAAPWVRDVTVGNPLLDAPLTPFVGSAPNVYYAVVPWLAYPLAGAVFGAIIARAPDPTAVFRRGALLGSGLIAVGIALIYVQRPGFDVYTYWRQPASFAVAIFGIILVWLAACDLVTRWSAIDRRLGIVYGWAHRLIAMYFSHWVIVGWGVGLVGFRALDLGQVLVAMVGAVVATSYLSRYAVKLESSWWRRGPAEEAQDGAIAKARIA